jgi:hypothetical protein
MHFTMSRRATVLAPHEPLPIIPAIPGIPTNYLGLTARFFNRDLKFCAPAKRAHQLDIL